ncbi:MAG: fused MFS/spermidine synthase [Bacillota bacterium]
MLSLLVLGSGAVLMGLEMLGSRLLAPYFGNSLYVWGSLISVFLSALSLGYLLGGRAADRWPRPSTLVRVALLAGAWVAVLPWLTPAVLESLQASQGPRLAPLLASLALFFGPGVLMGMVSPLAIRLRAKGVERLGQDAGGLYALSTAGSIAGTLLTSFWLVPAMGSRALLGVLGLTLLLLAGGYAVSHRRLAEGAVAAVLAAATLLAAVPTSVPGAPAEPGGAQGAKVMERMGGQLVEMTTVLEVDSLYHHIRVMDDGQSRYLRFDDSWQSGMYLDDPFRTRFLYTDYFTLPYALGLTPKKVLFIGLGGGSTPKHYWKMDPEVQVDVAEIDPEVVRVARRYFALPDDPRLTVTAQDGRLFLEQSQEKYDLIALDAYYADSIPFQLTTREFLEIVKAHLAPGGVVAANLIGAYEGPKSQLYRSFEKTFSAVFPTLYSFPLYWRNDPDTVRNIMLLATEEKRQSPERLAAAADRVGASVGVPELGAYARTLYQEPLETDDVPLLTDDHAPVDRLLYLQE